MIFFLHADKHQIFLQVETINFGHAQRIQNEKFAKSLHYLKKEFRDEIDF